MSIIDITFVTDPVAIIRDHPIASNSTPIALKNKGKGYVFGLTYWNDVNFGTYYPGYVDSQDNNEGGFALDINAAIKDTIRWRMVSLSSGFEYQCFIQSFTLSFGAGVMSSWGHKADAVSLPFRNEDGTVIAKQDKDCYWETTVDALGDAGYDIIFSIFDSNGMRVGIFSVDPYVQIPGTHRYALS